MTVASSTAGASLTQAGARSEPGSGSTRGVVMWLAVCCLLVFAMIVVGGVTRLTHSGLSITEWQPIVGTLPPLTLADWNEAFAKYQSSPEFRDVNHAMTLAEFKGIFWWEYFHRLLGRVIGVAFLAPYVWYLARRRIPARFVWPLAGIFALGGVQGVVGWLMVQSGLVDDPRVSQFRLIAHLGLAVAILGGMLWIALSLAFAGTTDSSGRHPPSLRRFANALVALVFVMILSGGLVAGIRAGFAYNTFPLMQGRIVPPEILALDPWWKNPFWNIATVQFDHRLIAWLLAGSVALFWWRLCRSDASRRAKACGNALLAMFAVQVALGIATLVNVVPLPLAALHQAGAVGVFALAVSAAHALR
jgi:cytochrome c oxidase assembly protein subunit 15